MNQKSNRTSRCKSPRAEHRQKVNKVIQEGLLNGEIRAVVRPDGQIGYGLTDSGRAALKAMRGDE